MAGSVVSNFDWSIVPSSVPDTASTLALLGGAMIGLAALRRKFARA